MPVPYDFLAIGAEILKSLQIVVVTVVYTALLKSI